MPDLESQMIALLQRLYCDYLIAFRQYRQLEQAPGSIGAGAAWDSVIDFDAQRALLFDNLLLAGLDPYRLHLAEDVVAEAVKTLLADYDMYRDDYEQILAAAGYTWYADTTRERA